MDTLGHGLVPALPFLPVSVPLSVTAGYHKCTSGSSLLHPGIFVSFICWISCCCACKGNSSSCFSPWLNQMLLADFCSELVEQFWLHIKHLVIFKSADSSIQTKNVHNFFQHLASLFEGVFFLLIEKLWRITSSWDLISNNTIPLVNL